MKNSARLLTLIVLVAGACLPGSVVSQTSTNTTWRYTLFEGSYLLKDCLICGAPQPRPPSILQPMRSTFDLVTVDGTSPVRRYALTNIDFATRSDPPYLVTGNGSYEVDTNKASHELVLNLRINGEEKVFTNDIKAVDLLWPMLNVHVVQTQENFVQFYSLNISAAPFRDLWFSTRGNFTRTNSGEVLTSGDLLSLSGRVVKPNAALIGRLGFMPGFATMDIDGCDTAPGAEVLFSLTQDQFSESLGQIRHGDLLSDRGYVVLSNQTLMANFEPQPNLPDFGLDALHTTADGQLFFSITTNAVSSRLGALSRGDVLSFQVISVGTSNRLYRTNQQLLSQFHPLNTATNYGLNALYIWPSGEVWFSTDTGFDSQQFGPVSEGDLLSDQGRIIFRNLELVSAFAPSEDASNFGLDALHVITDVTPVARAPTFSRVSPVRPAGDVRLEWTGLGRAFQVEKAIDVAGPYLPFSPIVPALTFTDMGALTNGQTGFYRLRQW